MYDKLFKINLLLFLFPEPHLNSPKGALWRQRSESLWGEALTGFKDLYYPSPQTPQLAASSLLSELSLFKPLDPQARGSLRLKPPLPTPNPPRPPPSPTLWLSGAISTELLWRGQPCPPQKKKKIQKEKTCGSDWCQLTTGAIFISDKETHCDSHSQHTEPNLECRQISLLILSLSLSLSLGRENFKKSDFNESFAKQAASRTGAEARAQKAQEPRRVDVQRALTQHECLESLSGATWWRGGRGAVRGRGSGKE